MKKYSNIEEIRLITETAFESSLAGFWDWNMETNEEYLSPRFKEMFGYADNEMENTPEAWQKIAFPEDLPNMFASFQKHIDSKGTIPFHSIVRYKHKNGSTVWVRCNGKVISWSKEGAPLRAIGCHIDITEEKEKEIALENALAEKNVLLSEVHHRVKNNLQIIQSIARLKQKENWVKLIDIEDSINAISKAHEAIYRTDRFDKINIKKYFSHIISPLLLGRKINLELNSEEIYQEIDVLIPIGLIITECVNNSLKHGFNINSSKKIISINVTQHSESLQITYGDNGCGFPLEVLESKNNLESFGISLINSLSEQINGEVALSNSNGAFLKISVPLVP